MKADNSLIPFARSYDGNEWEAAPGPLAINAKDVVCASSSCSILLPALANVGDSYIMFTKNSSQDDRTRIARFLEQTTFGPRMTEIDDLDDGSWGKVPMAQYMKNQIGLNATSHREYYRKRANAKVDASQQTARSDNPCSPLSKWRKYTYTKQDRHHTISEIYTETTFSTVSSEVNFTTAIYEADSLTNVACGECNFHNASTTSNSGYSGTGYLDFGGYEDYVSFTINVDESGVFPLSFRFSLGSSSYNGNRPLDLVVNNAFFRSIEFIFTDSWSYWKYTDLVDVPMNSGLNAIKLVVSAQNGGPNIDHLRIGKPPAVVLKTNGWPRTVAVNGVNLLDEWHPELANESSIFFPSYPDPPQGELYR
jgi:hypothetical protein